MTVRAKPISGSIHVSFVVIQNFMCVLDCQKIEKEPSNIHFNWVHFLVKTNSSLTCKNAIMWTVKIYQMCGVLLLTAKNVPNKPI